MKNIAITGGIGSGKSRVTEILRDLGYLVVDADEISKSITSPGGRAIPYIHENFGDEYINSDGSMNRALMRELIFTDPEKKALLEAGTTSIVIQDMQKIKEEAENSGEDAVFYDIPLLYENDLSDDYDAVWVVTADRDIRAERVMERDHISRDDFDRIINAQFNEDKRIERADHVIYNNGTLGELYRSVLDALECFDIPQKEKT